jgi:rubrerythrin
MKLLIGLVNFFSAVIIVSCNNNNSTSKSTGSEDFKGSRTFENLKVLANKEKTNTQKFIEYSQRAEKEGYASIAKLFLAISRSESIIESEHIQILKNKGCAFNPGISGFEVSKTIVNLQNSLKETKIEVDKTFPGYINSSANEKMYNIRGFLIWAKEISNRKTDFLQIALNSIALKNNPDIQYEYYVCPKCGNIFTKKLLPVYCELCMTYKGNFICIM